MVWRSSKVFNTSFDQCFIKSNNIVIIINDVFSSIYISTIH